MIISEDLREDYTSWARHTRYGAKLQERDACWSLRLKPECISGVPYDDQNELKTMTDFDKQRKWQDEYYPKTGLYQWGIRFIWSLIPVTLKCEILLT